MESGKSSYFNTTMIKSLAKAKILIVTFPNL